MTISVTSLGAGTNNVGTNTLGSVTVPAGALIVVRVVERNATGAVGTISDGTNTYTVAASDLLNGSAALGSVSLFYVKAASALSGATITYSKAVSGSKSALTAFYATGIDTANPLRNTSSFYISSDTNPSSNVTDGIGDLVVGHDGCEGTGGTWGNMAGWTTDTAEVKTGTATSDARVNGGYIVSGSGTSRTWSPTYSTGGVGTQLLASFKAGAAQAPGNFLPYFQ